MGGGAKKSSKESVHLLLFIETKPKAESEIKVIQVEFDKNLSEHIEKLVSLLNEV